MRNDHWSYASVPDCLAPLSFGNKAKIQARNYKAAGRFPVIDQGQEEIAGWTDDESAVIDAPLPLIVFGDHTRTFKFIDFPFARGADGTQLLNPKPGIDPLFLFYALRAIDLPARGYNRHCSVLKGQRVPLPADVDEQRAMGIVLGRVEIGAVHQSLLIETAQNLKRAAMHELFTRGLRGEPQKETEIGPVPESWDVVRFESAREWLQYGTSTRCKVEPASHPVLRIPNIESGHVNPGELKYCDLDASDAQTYLLQEGDLLFIRTNGVLDRLGSCAVYSGVPKRALFASYLIRARMKRELCDPRFAAHFYGSQRGTSLVASRATPAADGKYNMNTGIIDSLPLPLPESIEEQGEIVSILDAIDRKIDLHRRKRTVLEELFKALLHKLMTGEIRVSDLDLSALETPRISKKVTK